jgi:hypothetical protein
MKAATTLRSVGTPGARLVFMLAGALLLTAAAAARAAAATSTPPAVEQPKRAAGVCPPYKLKDEQGNVIDPVRGLNATAPHSPKQTCGAAGCQTTKKSPRASTSPKGKVRPCPRS